MTKIVLFHRDDDGYAAGSVAYKIFGDNAQYIGVQYGEEIPDSLNNVTKEDEVYIFDFSYKREICEEINNRCSKLIILDHHASAEQELVGLEYAVFDMNHSGNVLAWNFFYPGLEPTRFHKLTEDRDLWKFNFGDDSRALSLGITLTDISIKDTKKYLAFLNTLNEESILNYYVNAGHLLLRKQKAEVEKAKHARSGYKIVKFKDIDFIFYNTSNIINELAEAYYNDEKINICYTMSYFVLSDKIVFNLRSHKKTNISMYGIAVSMGGGGHRTAAGFTLPIVEGLDLVKQLLTQ